MLSNIYVWILKKHNCYDLKSTMPLTILPTNSHYLLIFSAEQFYMWPLPLYVTTSLFHSVSPVVLFAVFTIKVVNNPFLAYINTFTINISSDDFSTTSSPQGT